MYKNKKREREKRPSRVTKGNERMFITRKHSTNYDSWKKNLHAGPWSNL
jgi:hypothetical protein